MKAGAPSVVSSQLSTSFGSINPSEILLADRLVMCLRKFPDSALQALSGISLHTRPSSPEVSICMTVLRVFSDMTG